MKPLTAILLVLVLGPASLPAQATGKPLNVVLIMADDSAADNYGCYGSKFFKTPRLDALAAGGAKFNHCYSEPVCTSSRVKIMTGRDGIRNYVAFGTLDRDEITFGTMMKKAGYATAVAGKWQLHGGQRGSLAPDCGFDTYCLWNYPGGKRPRYWKPSIVRDGKLLESGEKQYGPDVFTDFIIEFIGKNKDRPFFAYYPMVLVHSPFPKTPDSKPTEEKILAKLKNFRDMTLYADKCVGRIVDALEKNGLRENTVIIYTTDNGTGRSLTYPFGDEQRKGEKAYKRRLSASKDLLESSKLEALQPAFTRDVANNVWHMRNGRGLNHVIDRLGSLLAWSDERILVSDMTTIRARSRKRPAYNEDLIGRPTKYPYEEALNKPDGLLR